MTAVFCRTYRDFQNFQFFPRTSFVRITNRNDTRGIKFDSVMIYIGWRGAGSDVMDALLDLKQRQPELFETPNP